MSIKLIFQNIPPREEINKLIKNDDEKINTLIQLEESLIENNEKSKSDKIYYKIDDSCWYQIKMEQMGSLFYKLRKTQHLHVCVRSAGSKSCMEISPESFEQDTTSMPITEISTCASNEFAFSHTEYKNSDKLVGFIKDKIQNFLRLYELGHYYSPYTTICQSTGFGKSRLVHQVGLDWYMAYFCLASEHFVGYPKRSFIANYFIPYPDLRDSSDVNIFMHYVAFFCVLFEKFPKNVPETQTHVQNKNLMTCEFQKEFLDEVNMRRGLLERQKAFKSFDSMTLKQLNEPSIRGKISVLFENAIQTTTSRKSPFLVVFDEAKSILYTHTNVLDYGVFLILRCIFRSFPKNVFVLFIDTTSKISNFVPSSKRNPCSSSRYLKNDDYLCPPIYLFPVWNIFKKDVMNINAATSPENVFTIGRPLWGSLYQSYKLLYTNYEYMSEEIIKLAVQKLCGGKKLDYKNLDEEMILAVIGSRTPININSFSQRAENLVANYMAVCTYINEKHDEIIAEYLSEPILVEAAARITKDIGLIKLIDVFKKSITQNSVFEEENRGEFIALIIFLAAWDNLCNIRINEKLVLRYHKFITVEDYLTSLFSKSVIEKLESQIDANIYKDFMNDFVYVTHFVKIKTAITKKDLKKYLSVGAGICCKDRTVGVDIIIPVALNCYSFDDDSISCILIQVKSRAGKAEPGSNYFDRIKNFYNKFKDSNDKTLYLYLYMQFGKDYMSKVEFKVKDVNVFGLEVSGYDIYSCITRETADSLRDFSEFESVQVFTDEYNEFRKQLYI